METYPPIVQNALGKMDEDQQLTFKSEYDKHKKTLAPMILATVFFIHFFLYGRVGLGVVYVVTMFFTIGFIWWAVEICMIGKRLRDHNDELAVNLMRDMKILT